MLILKSIKFNKIIIQINNNLTRQCETTEKSVKDSLLFDLRINLKKLNRLKHFSYTSAF